MAKESFFAYDDPFEDENQDIFDDADGEDEFFDDDGDDDIFDD